MKYYVHNLQTMHLNSTVILPQVHDVVHMIYILVVCLFHKSENQ